MLSTECPTCHGKRLKPEALSIKFASMDIADIARVPLQQLTELMRPYCENAGAGREAHPEKAVVVQRIAQDLSIGLVCCSISGSVTSRSSAARQLCRRVNYSACGSQRCRAGCRNAWRRDHLQRSPERFRQGREIPHTRISVRIPRSAERERTIPTGLASSARCHPQQPAKPRRRFAPRRADKRDRRIRVWQIQPGQPISRRRAGPAFRTFIFVGGA